MIPVQDIIDRATDLLLDKDREDDDARWSDAELLRWVNDARMAIIVRRPAACSRLAVVDLAEGTEQTIPSDGTMLLDVVRNIGANGTTPGRSIRRTDRQEIDDYSPDWHVATPQSSVSQFTYDDRTPRSFFVNPPAEDGVKIQIAYAAIPAQVDSTGDSLDIGLEYMDAVVNYVAYRAKSKDSEYANAAEATGYYGAFNDALGTQAQSASVTSPNQPGNSV